MSQVLLISGISYYKQRRKSKHTISRFVTLEIFHLIRFFMEKAQFSMFIRRLKVEFSIIFKSNANGSKCGRKPKLLGSLPLPLYLLRGTEVASEL